MSGGNDDFENEFGDVKQLPLSMVKEDKLVKRLRRNRTLLEKAAFNQTSTPPSPSTTTAARTDTVASPSTKNQDLKHEPVLKKSRTLPTPSPRAPKKTPIDKYARIRGLTLRRAGPGLSSLVKNQPQKDVSAPFPGFGDRLKKSLETSLLLDSMPLNGVGGNKYQHEKTKSIASPKLTRGNKPQTSDASADPQTLVAVKHRVLSQLHGNFANLDQSSLLKDKYSEIYRMIEHTVRDKEGHSALVIGPRSTGKSAMIDAALDTAEHKYPGQFIVIRLNAFVHTDDSVALRAIAKQIDKDNDDHDHAGDENVVHDEYDDEDEDQDESERGTFEQRSINDTFANILEILDSKGVSEKDSDNEADENRSNHISFVFVIDEFDKFTTFNKQTLLYNLFDLSQNSRTAVCVIGVSTRINARELLEKRVRSRFSNRIISINKPATLPEFWSEAQLGLLLREEFIQKLPDPEFGRRWNEYIDVWYGNEEAIAPPSCLKRLVYKVFFTTKNFNDFNNYCSFAVSNICPQNPLPVDTNVTRYSHLGSTNNIQGVFDSLSNLELLLVLAAARWLEKLELQLVNFNLAYAEYTSMIKSLNVESSTSRMTLSSALDNQIMANIKVMHKIWPADVLRNCWESVYKIGLLVDISPHGGGGGSDTAGSLTTVKSPTIEDSRMVQLDVTLQELGVMMHGAHTFKRLTRL